MKGLITLITSGQPSANPRLVKEATALQEAGYKVHVLYVPISPWADSFDQELFRKNPKITWQRVGYHPVKQVWGYRWSRMRRKVISKAVELGGDLYSLVDYSTILFGQELFRAAKKIPTDLFIAHNLGALPAAVKAARFQGAKVIFDAEDFHRGEFKQNDFFLTCTEGIENKYFRRIHHLNCASPLIAEAYTALFPNLSSTVINNVFPLSRRVKNKEMVQNESDGLRLFWFSQAIGENRGIEDIIKAMGHLSQLKIQLLLLGNISVEYKEKLCRLMQEEGVSFEKVSFQQPVPEEKIFEIAVSYDIGMCTEVPYCLNREYCLTNKVFTYLLCGNALLLSDTTAQRRFLQDYAGVGSLYASQSSESLAAELKKYYENPEILQKHKSQARSVAKAKLNWELESINFLQKIDDLLKEKG